MKKGEHLKVVHRNGHDIVEIFVAKKRYSDPKLFIPQKERESLPSPPVTTGMYISGGEPIRKGPLDKQFRFKRNIKLSEVSQRSVRRAGKMLAETYRASSKERLESRNKIGRRCQHRRKETAIFKGCVCNMLLTLRKKGKSQPTIDGYKFHLDRFNQWAENYGLSGLDVKRFSIDHFYEFWELVAV